ncbi:methyl-CpG-binding domain protein 3b isoform X4 [Megalobrama amblycephala]|uniref:methyl-CpG-binding domain protein 3b isoform X4 n=1 Tax=Megalobrama amblycephala TaxID=75352 RepID=UPI00201478A4|nr:methyl-CpG-binding domain protein 3b isoform X4 [Megalobrama amblycephala]
MEKNDRGEEEEEEQRRERGEAGRLYSLCPTGKKFRSKPQLARYLGNSMDLSSFDFRTGKMLMSKLNKNRQRPRYDNNSQTKGKPDLNTSLPVRQTASIFKQPVTKVTNHPSNKVKTDPQKAIDQPRQLFWEKKLSGLNAFDIAEELVKTMELPKGLQDQIHHAGMETKLVVGLCRGLVWFLWSLLRICVDGCLVDEVFTWDCLVDRIKSFVVASRCRSTI